MTRKSRRLGFTASEAWRVLIGGAARLGGEYYKVFIFLQSVIRHIIEASTEYCT